jgi:hypothetical protein
MLHALHLLQLTNSSHCFLLRIESCIVHFVSAAGYPRANQSSPWAESQDGGTAACTLCHLHSFWATIVAGDSPKGGDVQE